MTFTVVETLSLPGNPAKQNEDNFAAEEIGAVVLDGATPVSDPLLPGRSDAAWLSQFGARRLLSHLKAGDSARGALRHALADAEHSFQGLKRRAPTARYELPFASMIFAVPSDSGLDLLWFGDCAALLRHKDGAVEVIGSALEKKSGEADAATRYSERTGLAPVGALDRVEALPMFRESRAKANTDAGGWLFGVEPQASEHAARRKIASGSASLLLLCSDGFLALVSDYGAYDAAGLLKAAEEKGLAALGAELRAIEEDDSEGRKFPRFKKSDDATAVLVKFD